MQRACSQIGKLGEWFCSIKLSARFAKTSYRIKRVPRLKSRTSRPNSPASKREDTRWDPLSRLLQRCPREQGEGDGSEEISDSQVSTLTKVLGVLERHNNNLSEPIVAARTALSSAALESARASKKSRGGGGKTFRIRIRASSLLFLLP